MTSSVFESSIIFSMLYDCVTVTVTGIMPLSYFYDLCDSHMWYYTTFSSKSKINKKTQKMKENKGK